MKRASDSAAAVSCWLAAVMALAVLCLQVVPVLAPRIAADTALPPTFIGAYSGGLWAAALVGTAAAPALLARFDAWTLARACLALCAAGVLAATSGHPAALVLAALLVGLGHGLEGPVASHLLAAHVPVPRRPLWFSVKQAGVQVGAVAASLSLPGLATLFGWPVASAWAAAITVMLALLLALPRRVHAVPRAPTGGSHPLVALSTLTRLPVLRWLAVAAAAFGAMQICLNSFFVTFAVRERGATLISAGAWLAAAQLGGLVGRLFWGWRGNHMRSVMPLLLALGAGMSVCSALLGAFGTCMPEPLLWPLLVAFGLTASGWNGIFLAEVARQVPAPQAGTATAAVLLVMTAGLVAGPLVFSALAATLSFASAFTAWGALGALGVVALLQARRARRD
ncbi:MAG: MFS transporter [Burkholderiaceae bacterium]|jgi:MFS family permease|nr:MFS transporter [Burkholderiaceae bacterium]